MFSREICLPGVQRVNNFVLYNSQCVSENLFQFFPQKNRRAPVMLQAPKVVTLSCCEDGEKILCFSQKAIALKETKLQFCLNA
jgi:hypothetical protein